LSNAELLIRLEGVSKEYPKLETSRDRLRTAANLFLRRRPAPGFRALHDINLSVHRGESVGIIGENGAGKSTLLKIIAGVSRPSSGSVTLAGRVGALLELGTGFDSEYTGRENIRLSGALAGLSPRETARRAEAIIEFADIGDHIDEPIKHYSSGMVVRLGFAVATALEPEILITDEALAVGDESFQRKCIRWLERFRASGGTLLLVSHSMYHIQSLCSRAVWIDHGAMRLEGSAFDVTREYLAWHEMRAVTDVPTPAKPGGATPHVLSLWAEDGTGRESNTFRMGESAVLQGTVFDPEDRPPVLLLGIARVNGTGVCGLHTHDYGYNPLRIAARQFAFAIRFDSLQLLPGRYQFRAHALDPEGLRLFDTVVVEFSVTGDTRDYGVVRLPHTWLPGRGAPLASDTDVGVEKPC
jgi:lipopolysaccharide transport system ATP-binding protein